MNLVGILLLYFCCADAFSMEQDEPAEKMHSASRVSDESPIIENRDRRFTQEIILITNDELPPISRKKMQKNKTQRRNTDHRLTKSYSKKNTIKNSKKADKPVIVSTLETIRIPAQYLLKNSPTIENPSMPWPVDPVDTSSERTMAEKVRYFEGQQENFKKSLDSYLRNESLRENIIYTYPLFMDDKSFLKSLEALAEKKELLISELLYTFAIEEFFWRYPSIEAMLQLKKLLDKINASDPLRHKIWLALDARNRPIKKKSSKFQRRNKEDLYDELEALVPNDHLEETSIYPLLFLRDKRRMEWADANYIAQLMTLRDSNLFRSISIPQIILWAKEDDKAHSDHCIDSILELNSVMSRTVNFFTFLLICQKDRESRLKLAEKYVAIGQHLLSLNNFWGISQIVMALNKTEAARLFSWDKDSAEYTQYLFLDRAVSPLENFRTYNTEVNKLQKGQHFLPLMTNLWRDINLAIFEQRPEQINANWLSAVGNLLAIVQQWRKHCVYDIALIKGTRNFLEDLPNISDEILQEFSIAHAPWKMYANREPPDKESNVSKWSGSELVIFFEKNALAECIKPILRQHIWSGRELIEFLGDNPKTVKRDKLLSIGCPVEQANTIAMLSQFWPAK